MWRDSKKKPTLDPEEMKQLIERLEEDIQTLSYMIEQFDKASIRAGRVLTDLNKALAQSRETTRLGRRK